MPATASGIFHNLKESEYTVSDQEAVFFFSSKLYLNKFLTEYQEHRSLFDKRMKFATNKQLPYNTDTLADLVLYSKIEKRGFHCWVKGVSMDWQNMHAYALRKMTEKSSPVWQRTPRQKLTERLKTIKLT